MTGRDPNSVSREELQRLELEILRNSREFQLGSRLRQSGIFKLVRRWRLKRMRVQVQAQPTRAAAVRLLGVWYDEYPHGLPLELLEFERGKWRFDQAEGAPFQTCMQTYQVGSLAVYTTDENLRLDFETQPGAGHVLVRTVHGSRQVSLSSAQPGVISIYPQRGGNLHQIEVFTRTPQGEIGEYEDAQGVIGASGALDEAPGSGQVALLSGKRMPIAPADQAWIEAQQANPRPLSLNHPDWRGILASARELFDNIYTLPDDLDRTRAEYYAQVFKEAGPPSITIQGFPRTYSHLVKALRKFAPQMPVYVIYHGNFLHMREDYDWRIFKLIQELHTQGDVAKIGFVKQGMAEVLAKAGMQTGFILNMARRIPPGPSQTLAGGPHIGIWGQPDWSWKKSPYAMLAALKLIPGARGHAINVSPRVREFGELLDIEATYQYEALSQEQVLSTLADMHLNLYVTLTECAPMMPLESLSTGAPCLFGPTSHYFLDHAYLHQRLVVPYPDNAETIARFANQALEEREQIIDAYRAYAPLYNQRALQALSDFLEYPMALNAQTSSLSRETAG